MAFPLGISDSQKKQPPLPPSVVSQSDSGSGRDFDNGASFLTFQGTTFTGKLPIVDYTVTATATDNSDTVSVTVNSVNPFVFTGLKSGKSYKFKIRARNQVYNSADSSEFGPGLATTVPGRTTSAGATNLANGGGASLSWTAPSNGGKTITSYLITPNIGTPVETGSSSTSYTFSGLTVGTPYSFTVAARNENGVGQASTTTNQITITNAPTPPPTPPPAPVAYPNISSATAYGAGAGQVWTQNEAYVTWAGSGWGSYKVTASNGVEQTSLTSAGGPPLLLTGFSAGTTYSVTVTLYANGSFTGNSASASTSFTTAAAVSTGPSGPPADPCSSLYYASPVIAGSCYNSTFCCDGTFYSTYNCAGTLTSRSCVANCSSSQCVPTTPPPPPPAATFYCVSLGRNIPVGSVCPGIVSPPVAPPTTPPPPSCIVETTEVLTPTGTILAKDVKVGTVVRSIRFSELSTDETAYSLNDWKTPVLTPVELVSTTITSIVTSEVRNSYIQINGDAFTAEHPVLVYDGSTYRFKQAKDVVLNDLVLKLGGNSLTQVEWNPVTFILPVNKKVMVYQFDTEDQDVLFTKNLLSHNLKAPVVTPPPPTPPPPPRGGGCLVSSTLISTPIGFVKAKDIKVGDLVHSVKFAELSTDETVDTIMSWSTNILTPTELTTSVIKKISIEKPVDYYLSLNGDLMTPEHPVLVRHNGIHSFMQAGDVHVGYEVLKRNGDNLFALEWVPVVSNDFIEAKDTVYLFDAEDDDVIFTANMLTHNIKLAAI